jgi:hypothetical protein
VIYTIAKIKGVGATVPCVKKIKSLWIKSSIYYTFVYSWLWPAVAFVDCVKSSIYYTFVYSWLWSAVAFVDCVKSSIYYTFVYSWLWSAVALVDCVKSSIYFTFVYSWLWSAVAFVDCVKSWQCMFSVFRTVIGSIGHKTRQKIPCPVLVEFSVSWLVEYSTSHDTGNSWILTSIISSLLLLFDTSVC